MLQCFLVQVYVNNRRSTCAGSTQTLAVEWLSEGVHTPSCPIALSATSKNIRTINVKYAHFGENLTWLQLGGTIMVTSLKRRPNVKRKSRNLRVL